MSNGGAAYTVEPDTEQPRFARLTTAEGLSSNSILCFVEDTSGRLYICTGHGVDRRDPKTGYVSHYGPTEGLHPDGGDLTTGFRDRRGDLWFGSSEGLVVRFTPRPVLATQPPRVWMSGVQIGGAPQGVSELGERELVELKVPWDRRQIHVEYSVLNFEEGRDTRVQYKLEGNDAQGWSRPVEQRAVDLISLPPGQHRLLIRAVMPNGRIDDHPAAATFLVLPPFWRTWWFLTITAGLAVFVAGTIHHYRVSRLLELERVRMRIATDLHDDIGSSLSQIAVLSEVARQLTSLAPSTLDELSTIADLSRQVLDSLNDIVWAISPRRDSLSDLTRRMRRFANDVFSARSVRVTFDEPAPHINLQLGPDVRREVFLVFKEAIKNVLRHSECTQITIRFCVRNGRLELSLEDNGQGFDGSQPSDGNGLVSMRQRAERLGGLIEISSVRGQGTTVRMTAPLARPREGRI
jgi:two-component sensor histidine kinase